jgi:hypothetical protein
MAPDLEAVIRADWLDKKRVKEIARGSRRADVFGIHAHTGFFHRDVSLLIPGVHEILTDDFDFDSITWDMDAQGLEHLARTLEWLYQELPGPFTFEALWGEDPIEKRVSRPELLRLVRACQIGTRTLYRVPAATERPT